MKNYFVCKGLLFNANAKKKSTAISSKTICPALVHLLI
jgi:hypothetical protein